MVKSIATAYRDIILAEGKDYRDEFPYHIERRMGSPLSDSSNISVKLPYNIPPKNEISGHLGYIKDKFRLDGKFVGDDTLHLTGSQKHMKSFLLHHYDGDTVEARTNHPEINWATYEYNNAPMGD